MRRLPRLLGAVCGAIALLALPAAAGADPGEDHSHENHSGPPELAPFAGPAFSNMALVGNSDKDGTTNSDLAFWGDLAFAGNYDGFRILDISNPASPAVLSDYVCRGPQNDVSVYRLRGRLYLFQSIDTPQTKASCDGTRAGSSRDTALVGGQREFGFEGIRVFDVTNPAAPVFVTGVPTACGSHTHTLVPDRRNQRVLLYVSSYPLLSNVTPSSYTGPGPRCESPHKKISIVEVSARNPAGARVLREEPLSSDSGTYPGAVAGDPLRPPFIACHDIQVFLKDKVAIGSCGGDGQIWDISDPANPTASDGERHTHFPTTGFTGDDWEFVHNAIVTWDGKFFAFADETGGGGTNECDGSAEERGGQSENGFYYFYEMVKPGEPASPLLSRYMIPRPQGTEICVSHNGNVLPTDDGYFLVSAYYQGGNTLVDFTDPANPTEIAYSDPADAVGLADSWSTYWYNGFAYANGGLDRRGATGNRGLDVLAMQRPDGTAFRTRRFHHMNPQTQEKFQSSGSSNSGSGSSD